MIIFFFIDNQYTRCIADTYHRGIRRVQYYYFYAIPPTNPMLSNVFNIVLYYDGLDRVIGFNIPNTAFLRIKKKTL